MINANQIQVGINAQGAKKGADDVNSALKSIERSLQSVQKVLTDVNKTANAGGGGGGGGGGPTGDIGKNIPEANTALLGFMQTLNKIRNTLFVVYLLREAFDGLTYALRTLVATGIEFNAIMEQAVVGTGGLIAQIGNLEKNDIKLEGVEALRAGMQLAKEEVLQLQIAGLQTAATSTALVNAFQQAVGPGLAAGLALREVRDLTVDIVQVATAIGLPMHQIAQEVRAIVEGTIDPNARVAKVLQIDNATIQKMKESGKLAEFLFQKLDKFRAIGPIIEKTWSGVTSNLQEFGEVLSGLVTQPLFERLTNSLVKFNNEFREGGAGRGAEELKDLFALDIQSGVESLQKSFAELGNQTDRVLVALLDRARDMLAAFGEDEQVETLSEAIRRLGDVLVKVINEADVAGWARSGVDALNDLTKAFKELDEAAGYVNRALKIVENSIYILLTAVGLLIRGVDLLTNPKATLADWGKMWQNHTNEVNGYIDQITQAWEGAIPVNKLETAAERAANILGATKQNVDFLRESITGVNNEWDRFLLHKPSDFKQQVREAPFGASVFDIDAMSKGKSYADVAGDIRIRTTRPPPKVDKGAAGKAQREAERLAAKERAFQLAKLQLIEQTARDEIGLRDSMNKILLKQNEERYDREIINLHEFENEKKRILIAGATDENTIALLRVKGAVEAGRKALSQITTLAPFKDVAGANFEGLEAYKKQLAALIDVVKTQEQTEAVRELIQALTGLQESLLRLKVAQGGFELDKLPVIKQRPPIDLPLPSVVAETAMSANLRKEREKILALAKEEAQIQKAVTLGYITQAEAAERLADHAERDNKLQIEILKGEIERLDVVTQAGERLEKNLELVERMNKVFRISNSDAFFKGLNANIDKLSDKFQRLGEDIRSIFRDAFEELGRTGFRGFVDTFLQGIADALNTRAADALSQIVTKILTDIFKPGGSGQSIFDKLIEQLLSIFGRKPTGTLSIGGIFEKIFGKLLDPLGKKKDLPIAGLPTGSTGLPTILGDLQKGGGTIAERTQALLTTLDTTVTGIYRDTTDMAQSLRELKQCCAEHNNLLKQQMANAAKGPGLLGAILSAAAGAAAGAFVGGISFGGGIKLPGQSEGVNIEGVDRSPAIPGLPELPFPVYPSRPDSGPIPIPQNVTTNITIQTPNAASFNAPQTQAQIGSLVFNNIQKAQTLVPAITNPNKP